MHNKRNIFRKAETTSNLGEREYVLVQPQEKDVCKVIMSK
jgi:hypothetical protein